MEISPLNCNAEQLYTVVGSHNRKSLMLCLSNPAMTEDHVIALLRNSNITEEIVRAIHNRTEWTSSYRVQVAMANCPKTSLAAATRLLQMLFWNDLLKVTGNYRLSPQIRRTAENYLREKIPGLTLGEKISLSRTAPRSILPLLRTEKEHQVILALLRNPHLLEEDVLLMIHDHNTPPTTLITICRDPKWSLRYPVRLALVRNRRTPLAFALSFLTGLHKYDLKSLLHDPQSRELVRQTAHRILTGQY